MNDIIVCLGFFLFSFLGNLPESILITESKIFSTLCMGDQRSSLFSYCVGSSPEWRIDIFKSKNAKKNISLTRSLVYACFVMHMSARNGGLIRNALDGLEPRHPVHFADQDIHALYIHDRKTIGFGQGSSYPIHVALSPTPISSSRDPGSAILDTIVYASRYPPRPFGGSVNASWDVGAHMSGATLLYGATLC